MKLVDGSLRRPVTVTMATVACCLFGFVALSRLGVELLPNISYPSLTVRTDLPDAAPSDVEQFVTRPVEEGVGVVPGLVRMHSISRPGQSEVTLEFASSTRMDLASLSVREKLDLVTLPREAKRPAILRFDPSLEPILRFRLSGGGGNLQRLRRIAERTIKADLEGVAGVAAVRVAGGEEEEIQVDVDAGRLSSVGLTLTDVTRRLSEENVNVAGGSLTDGQSEYLVRATNQFLDPAEIANVILASRPDGVIRVSDVARVRRGSKDREVVARVNGDEAVEVAVYKEGDANTVAVAGAVSARLKKIDLPGDMKVVTVADQSRFIRSAIDDVNSSALLGGLLAIIVLFAFLKHLRSTITIALAIPISVLVTFIAMYRLGVSLNIMSLGGLALSVGNLVDSAIVVLEAISRRRRLGEGAIQAASKGTAEVAMAVVASTFTTIAVFFPLVFVQGLAGQLIRDQALTITFSHLVSLVVALTIVPMSVALGAKARLVEAARDTSGTLPTRRSAALRWALFIPLALPRMIVHGTQAIGRWLGPLAERALVPFDRSFAWLVLAYPPFARRALERPRVVLAWAGAAFAAALFVGWLLPVDLFPTPSQGEFTFDVRLPEGSALRVTDHVLDGLAKTVRDDPSVRFVYTSTGQRDLAAFSGSALEANRGQLTVVMKHGTDRKGETRVADRIRGAIETLPGVAYEFERPSLLKFKNPIEVEVYASDLDSLRTASGQIARAVAGVPGLTDVEASIRPGDPEVQITFDRDRLANLQLDPTQASRLVRNAVQGEAATQFSDVDRKLDVRVRATESERSQVAQLANLEVGRNDGRPVLLGAVANVAIERGPSEIRRIGQQRAAVVSGNLAGRDLGSAAKDIETRLAALDLPPGVRAYLAGQNRELAESSGSLRFALLLAVFLVYLVMASQFESLLHPFVVMFTIPLGVVGVVAGLVVTGTSISVMVLIGLVILAGIVVNNAIVLVDCANQLRREGMKKVDALVEAGSIRLRPILMTMLTTVLGTLPMAFAFGEGAEVRSPLAITLIGGLTLATILTLVVIPAVYVVFDRSE